MTRAILSLALLTLAACEERGPIACTAEARSSVTVLAQDAAGNPLTDATATYRVDGVDKGACEEMVGDIVCGWETEGHFEIDVSAPGYLTETVVVDVEADECHVVSTVVDAYLEPEAWECTEVVVPAVTLVVTDGQGQDVTSGTVTWTPTDTDMAPQPCDHAGGNTWHCANERSGGIELAISDAGPYEFWTEVVEVQMDAHECHPITETVEAVLQYLPD